jgi:RNA polymerase sigma factor (sigma-70 family)
VVDEPITESELKLARQGATSAWKSGRGIIDKDDLVGEANLWIVEHLDKVRQWRDEGRHGQNKLRNACRQRCLTVVARERRRQSQLTRGDLAYYTPQVLRELLPAIFHVEDWVSGEVRTGETRAPSRPSEGNTRLAMIVDVRSAFDSLPPKDKTLLIDLYADGGLAVQIVAAQLEVSERTVRRREERALDKMVERLGGEPPWYR